MRNTRRIFSATEAILIVCGLVFVAWAFMPLEESQTRTVRSSEPDVAGLVSPVDNVTTSGIWVLLEFSVWTLGGKFSGLVGTNLGLPDSVSFSDVWWSVIPQQEYEGYVGSGHFIGVINPDVGQLISDYELTPGTYYLIFFKGYRADLPPSFEIAFWANIDGAHGVFLVLGIILLLSTACIQVFSSYWKRRRRGLAPVDSPPIEPSEKRP